MAEYLEKEQSDFRLRHLFPVYKIKNILKLNLNSVKKIRIQRSPPIIDSKGTKTCQLDKKSITRGVEW